MNQKGYSWPEAILTVAVLSVIFSTLLPIATHMTMSLHKKKISMYAAETLYRAAVAHEAYGQSTGSRKVNEVLFDWQVNGNSICASYELYREAFTKCVEISG